MAERRLSRRSIFFASIPYPVHVRRPAISEGSRLREDTQSQVGGTGAYRVWISFMYFCRGSVFSLDRRDHCRAQTVLDRGLVILSAVSWVCCYPLVEVLVCCRSKGSSAVGAFRNQRDGAAGSVRSELSAAN